MMISVRCAECRCVQQECINVDVQGCSLCTKDVCCCENIHNSSRRCSTLKKPLTMAKIIATPEHEDCCASGSCENNNYSNDGLQPNLTTRRITSASTSSFSSSGFIPNLKTTFKNFVVGITKLPHLHRQPNLKYILKSSAYILVTAESACILTAETVDLLFYQYSIFLAIPLALLGGAFTVVAPEAYRKIKQK